MIRLLPFSQCTSRAPCGIRRLSSQDMRILSVSSQAISYCSVRENSSKSKKKITYQRYRSTSRVSKEKRLSNIASLKNIEKKTNSARGLSEVEYRALKDVYQMINRPISSVTPKGLTDEQIDKLEKVRCVLGRLSRSGTMLPPSERLVVNALASPTQPLLLSSNNEIASKVISKISKEERVHYKAIRNIITAMIKPYHERRKLQKSQSPIKRIVTIPALEKKLIIQEDQVLKFLKKIMTDLVDGKSNQPRHMRAHLQTIQYVFGWDYNIKNLDEDIAKVQEWNKQFDSSGFMIPSLVQYAKSLQPEFLDYYLFVTAFLKICTLKDCESEKDVRLFAKQVNGFRDLCSMIDNPLVKDILLGLWTLKAPTEQEQIKTLNMMERDKIHTVTLDFLRSNDENKKPMTDLTLIGFYRNSEERNLARSSNALTYKHFLDAKMCIQDIPKGKLRDETIIGVLKRLSHMMGVTKENIEYLRHLTKDPVIQKQIDHLVNTWEPPRIRG